jgi:hypothetical protein
LRPRSRTHARASARKIVIYGVGPERSADALFPEDVDADVNVYVHAHA